MEGGLWLYLEAKSIREKLERAAREKQKVKYCPVCLYEPMNKEKTCPIHKTGFTFGAPLYQSRKI